MLLVKPEQAMTRALSAGISFFQYRNKRATRKTIYETARLLSSVAHQSHALFIVNDHADIAEAVDADGVHLGQDDLPIEQARKILGSGKIIGISTHSREQAMAAERSGADYIGFGPIFPTTTKDAGELQGINTLKIVKSAVGIPLIAIGGITQKNIGDVIRSGADGAAVISAILSSDDITLASHEIMTIIAKLTR
jgi:thiamine-phosphate diphosphorylase